MLHSITQEATLGLYMVEAQVKRATQEFTKALSHYPVQVRQQAVCNG